MPPVLSRPKHEIRIVLLENIAPTARETLSAAGYTNIEQLKTALDGDDLIDKIRDATLVGIRSRTQMTREVLKAVCTKVYAIGCFSVGTNQVDLEAARECGIPVFNAPFSNTRSVAELTIAETVMLMRRTFEKSAAAHDGRWEKSATGSFEVRGKTLGIIGYGNIGTQLAMLGEAMGMRVIYHDVTNRLSHGNVKPAESLKALLAAADVVSLHVPETRETVGMMTREMIRAMKPGSYLINNARGTVVDIEALAAALRDNHLSGAAIDVFPKEPSSPNNPFESPLRGLRNVILTPHVGGSTEEAQLRIGDEVARKFVDYGDTGTTVGAVNFPEVQMSLTPGITRFIQVHRNEPGQLRKLNKLFERHELNIVAQHLKTLGEIGYVVLDAEGVVPHAVEILHEIRAMPGTLRARLLNRVA